MKRSVIAILLALWTILALLPLRAQACESYEITANAAEGADRGCLELYADRACAGETVRFRAEPLEGYVVRFDGCCDAGFVDIRYEGLGMYAFEMPQGAVGLQIRFVPAEGALYPLVGVVNDPALGQLVIRRADAREGEWVVIEAVPQPGCTLQWLDAMGTDGLPVQGGYVEKRQDVLIYEYCLPNAGIVLEAEFVRLEQDETLCFAMHIREQLQRLRQWMLCLPGLCF